MPIASHRIASHPQERLLSSPMSATPFPRSGPRPGLQGDVMQPNPPIHRVHPPHTQPTPACPACHIAHADLLAKPAKLSRHVKSRSPARPAAGLVLPDLPRPDSSDDRHEIHTHRSGEEREGFCEKGGERKGSGGGFGISLTNDVMAQVQQTTGVPSKGKYEWYGYHCYGRYPSPHQYLIIRGRSSGDKHSTDSMQHPGPTCPSARCTPKVRKKVGW